MLEKFFSHCIQDQHTQECDWGQQKLLFQVTWLPGRQINKQINKEEAICPIEEKDTENLSIEAANVTFLKYLYGLRTAVSKTSCLGVQLRRFHTHRWVVSRLGSNLDPVNNCQPGVFHMGRWPMRAASSVGRTWSQPEDPSASNCRWWALTTAWMSFMKSRRVITDTLNMKLQIAATFSQPSGLSSWFVKDWPKKAKKRSCPADPTRWDKKWYLQLRWVMGFQRACEMFVFCTFTLLIICFPGKGRKIVGSWDGMGC